MLCKVITHSTIINEDLLTNDCVYITFTNNYQQVKIPQGEWKFELWGAAGVSNDATNPSGKGAYVKGVIKLREELDLFCYVGGQGKVAKGGVPGSGGFNGGCEGGKDTADGNSAAGGSGGATDIRLQKDDLYSRIIVAGGGGSSGFYFKSGKGGSGGTIVGLPGSSNSDSSCKGGLGGDGKNLSLFGVGQEGQPGNEAAGSGGGGYFGGYGGKAIEKAQTGSGGGGGGSSYVSGCNGCHTLYKDDTFHGSIHYSGYKFNHIEMYDGDSQLIPYKINGITYDPHITDGLIRISRFTNYDLLKTCIHKIQTKISFILLCFIIIFKK